MDEALGIAGLHGCPPGADFPRALVEGLHARMGAAPPEALARIEIFVNTRRMQRRLAALFTERAPGLYPRIRVIGDLPALPIPGRIRARGSDLRLRIELAQLVGRLLERAPDLAPRTSLFDLSDTLADLIVEMHDEAVSIRDVTGLDVSDQSGHWQRSRAFLEIAGQFVGADTGRAHSAAQTLRLSVEALLEFWKNSPPDHPIIVAGSTGSRGPTSLLMKGVLSLKAGAVILPGFDFDLPAEIWKTLADTEAEDHPQYRFSRLMDELGLSAQEIRPWLPGLKPPVPARNRLVSLALRPAPVTGQWMREGPKLPGIGPACEGLGLIEAATGREEAEAIALALRKALEEGKTAALITPDQTLSRRVVASLDRWGIEPDFSAGVALDLTAPGRLLRQIAALFASAPDETPAELIGLLQHPLVCNGTKIRAAHLDALRSLEHALRKTGPGTRFTAFLEQWAREDTAREAWAAWVLDTLLMLHTPPRAELGWYVSRLRALAERLAAGPQGEGSGALWEEEAGEAVRACMDGFAEDARHGGTMHPAEFAAFLDGVLRRDQARSAVRPDPRIMIWGTLEARVQGADLLVLGGLVEGVWPAQPAADPWLNRALRKEAGLLVPERRIGLAAHDFQQAVCAREVILSRALRDEQAATVPSRWLNRLMNLLQGVSDEGRQALAQMRHRGEALLNMARKLDAAPPVPPDPRPAPRPPVSARPRKLSVTAIRTLIRDPYAIYAQYILKLKPLDPLMARPDARLRGVVLHEIFEAFIDASPPLPQDPARARQMLIGIARKILERRVPFPAQRLLWLAALERISAEYIADEARRWQQQRPICLEAEGALLLPKIDFTLTAKADRIDRRQDGTLVVYDYKSGPLPTENEIEHFDVQLPLTVMMLEHGGFKDLQGGIVHSFAHIGIGSGYELCSHDVSEGQSDQIRKRLQGLISHYFSPNAGYPSRIAIKRLSDRGPYDHLARHGEWSDSDLPQARDVGRDA